MTTEQELIQRYFDAFNRHDVEAVMACFDEHAVVVDAEGQRTEGAKDVRRHYEIGFAQIPDGRCDLRATAGARDRGMAESLFQGTDGRGRVIKALGVEVIEFVDGKIREIRDYHRLVE